MGFPPATLFTHKDVGRLQEKGYGTLNEKIIMKKIIIHGKRFTTKTQTKASLLSVSLGKIPAIGEPQHYSMK